MSYVLDRKFYTQQNILDRSFLHVTIKLNTFKKKEFVMKKTQYLFLISIFLMSQTRPMSHPLLTTGSEVVSDKGIWQVQPELELLRGKNISILVGEIDIAYGLTDSFGFELDIPFFFDARNNNNQTAGIGDLEFTGEWQVYKKETHLISLIGGFLLPTGDRNKRPITGGGSLGFTGEIRTIHSSKKWYAEAIIDLTGRIKKNGKRFGPRFGFDFTLGPSFFINGCDPSNLLIVAEMRGEYFARPKLFNELDDNFGGLLIFLGPSFIWTKDSITTEALLQFPIAQRLFGDQNKFDFRIKGSILFRF